MGVVAGTRVPVGWVVFLNAIAVRELSSLTLVWLRVAIAAAVLLLVVRAMGQGMPRDGRTWAAFFGMGLLNNALPFTLIVWGQHSIASGLASILNDTTPLFTVLAAHALTSDERVTPSKAAGVAVGFAGAVVMVSPDARSGLGTDVLAQLACLAAALSYAFAGVFGRRFRRMGVAPLTTAAGQVSASTIMLLPVMLAVDRPWALAIPGPATWGAVLGLGVASTAVAYVLFFRILAVAGATNLALVTLLVPISAILLGGLVLNETLLARHAVGMALIGVGLAFLDGRLGRWLLKSMSAPDR